MLNPTSNEGRYDGVQASVAHSFDSRSQLLVWDTINW